MTAANFRQALRSASRGLWTGALNYDQAWDSMAISIRRNLTNAWNRGAAECDIKPDELTPEEITNREMLIITQLSAISAYLTFVEQNAKSAGKKPADRVKLLARKGSRTIYGRLELWVRQWDSAYTKAQAMACADAKGQWELGRTEKHCRTCYALNGKVKRFSWWASHVLPQNAPNAQLECGGWRCDCRIVKTDASLSRGAMPRLP